jgi:hypothetical protein
VQERSVPGGPSPKDDGCGQCTPPLLGEGDDFRLHVEEHLGAVAVAIHGLAGLGGGGHARGAALDVALAHRAQSAVERGALTAGGEGGRARQRGAVRDDLEGRGAATGSAIGETGAGTGRNGGTTRLPAADTLATPSTGERSVTQNVN